MTDTLLLALVIALSAAAVVCSIRQVRSNGQEILWREIRRDLDRHRIVVLKHCGQIQRQLDRHHRTLKYLTRRLS
jgi:hypothetical protein